MYEYDKSSKWLIKHHGDSILRLAGVEDIASWTPLQAELVEPRQLPDGVLSALEYGQSEPDIIHPGDRELSRRPRPLAGCP
jgi:hypothetical protein